MSSTCTDTANYDAASGNTAVTEGNTYLFHRGNVNAWDASGYGISTLVDLSGFTAQPYVNGSYTRVFSLDGAPTPANCSVTYLATPAGGSAVITMDDSGC